jgi:LysM repeat protein
MIASSLEPPDTYIVQPGNTLSSIAQSQLGNAFLWPEIYQANRGIIANPAKIDVGWRLKIPSRHSATASTTSKVIPYIPRHASNKLSGTLSCSGLEQLWDNAGGSPVMAFTAARIAMAESGGNQYATGLAGERGYWQINPDHGALSTYDPMGNAHAAILISADGTNWTPWTTYTSGLYLGECQ